jgi:hypothetical protein
MTPKQFTLATTYFLQEGQENMRECLKIAFQVAKQQNISKVVIFTARGDGIRIALQEFCCLDEYKKIRPVAVTFPFGKKFTKADGTVLRVAIEEADETLFRESGVPIIRAHMPFDPIGPLSYKQGGNLGQDLSLIGEALNMFGGSMSLCVQAILMACDAGAVGLGEHVIASTSDTAILAQGTCTRQMLEELVIREILCKPAVLTVGRKEVAEKFPAQLELGSGASGTDEEPSSSKQLSEQAESPLGKPKI